MTRRSTGWEALLAAMMAGAAAAGVLAWRVNLQAIDREVKQKRSDIKKLVLSGGIPPNQEVVDYLNARQASLEQRYTHWIEQVTVPPIAEAAAADPQLFFQEQVHEVQRTVERLATARKLAVPEQLGFPKELPPSDTVPRLLVQLSMIEESTGIILQQGVAALTSLKVEDPEPVPEEDGGGPFLTRLPLRVRLTCSLPQLMKTLGALERATPLLDVRTVRVANGASPETLDVELLLARYLLAAPLQDQPLPEEAKGPKAKAGAAKASQKLPSKSKQSAAGGEGR